MSEPGYHDALRVLCQDAGAELHRVLAEACESVPAWDPVVTWPTTPTRCCSRWPVTWPSRRWRG